MGALGILQVRNEFRNIGLGSLLVKALSKLAINNYGVDVTAHIVIANDTSKRLFTKLGFVSIQRHSWIGFKD